MSVIETVASLADEPLRAKLEAGPGFSVRRVEDWVQWNPPDVESQGQDRWQFTYEAQDGGLQATCDLRLDRRFMVAVYQVTLKNLSQTDALALSQLASASIRFRDFAQPQVFSCSGASNDAAMSMTREYPSDSFRPKWISPMEPRYVYLSSGQATIRGSGSSHRNLPLFMLRGGTDGDDSGMFVGLEWSTCWQAWVNFDGAPDQVHLLMGPETEKITLQGGERLNWGYWACPVWQSSLTKLVLAPGRSAQLPAIHVGFFNGGFEGGTNACRRYIHQRLMPRYQGKPTLPPVAYTIWGGIVAPYTDEQLRPHVAAAAEMGVEMFCVDADWYEGTYGTGLGNWRADPEKFPDGIEAFAQYVQSKGMGMGLYFDGSAVPGTRLVREHPEFFYNIASDHTLKYNFGDPDACDYWIEMVGGFIERCDLRYIRFEITGEDPVYAFTWDMVDPSGMAPLAWVQGLYRVSETLTLRYPNLVLELNSGGGNLIDLGTMKRHHCGWGNDNSGHPHACHNMQLGANQFIPPHFIGLSIGADTGGTVTGLDSTFSDLSFLSRMAGQLLLHGRLADWPAHVQQRAKHWITVYKKIRHLLVLDYYRLLAPPQSDEDWDAGQFCDGSDQGVVFVFRVRGRAQRQVLFLRRIDKNKTYQMCNESTGALQRIPGTQLDSQGFPVRLEPDSAALYSYQIQ